MAEFAEPVVTPSPSQPPPTVDQATVTPKSSKKLPPLLDNPAIAYTPYTIEGLEKSNKLKALIEELEKSINKSKALSSAEKALSPAEKAKLASIKVQLIAANNNIKSGNIVNAKTQIEKIHFSGFDPDYDSMESIGKTNYSMWDIRTLIQEIELDMISSVEDIDWVKTSKNLIEAIRVISDVTKKSKPLIIKGK